jgi:hypothetical protein
MSISIDLESYQRKDYQGYTIENATMTSACANTFKDI